MTMLADMRLALRITSDVFDGEVQMLIDAAMSDLMRVGVPEDYINGSPTPPLVRQAITCFCRAHFGFDNEEAARFDASYRQLAIDLADSASMTEVEE